MCHKLLLYAIPSLRSYGHSYHRSSLNDAPTWTIPLQVEIARSPCRKEYNPETMGKKYQNQRCRLIKARLKILVNFRSIGRKSEKNVVQREVKKNEGNKEH